VGEKKMVRIPEEGGRGRLDARVIQWLMQEQKGYLETTIEEMEGLREKYGKYR